MIGTSGAGQDPTPTGSGGVSGASSDKAWAPNQVGAYRFLDAAEDATLVHGGGVACDGANGECGWQDAPEHKLGGGVPKDVP